MGKYRKPTTGEQQVLDGVKVRLVRRSEEKRFEGLIRRKHYLKNMDLVGRRLKFLINNSRYVILTKERYPNLATRVMGLCLQRGIGGLGKAVRISVAGGGKLRRWTTGLSAQQTTPEQVGFPAAAQIGLHTSVRGKNGKSETVGLFVLLSHATLGPLCPQGENTYSRHAFASPSYALPYASAHPFSPSTALISPSARGRAPCYSNKNHRWAMERQRDSELTGDHNVPTMLT